MYLKRKNGEKWRFSIGTPRLDVCFETMMSVYDTVQKILAYFPFRFLFRTSRNSVGQSSQRLKHLSDDCVSGGHLFEQSESMM